MDFLYLLLLALLVSNIVIPKLYNINESEELKREGYKGLILGDFNLPSP